MILPLTIAPAKLLTVLEDIACRIAAGHPQGERGKRESGSSVAPSSCLDPDHALVGTCEVSRCEGEEEAAGKGATTTGRGSTRAGKAAGGGATTAGTANI